MPADISSPSTPVREPKQNRSRASFEKVIAAARTLLAQRGYESFTLNDVVKESGVSIGSIYGRVSGKDDLLRVVQERVLEEMAVEERALLSAERWEGVALPQMLPALIDGLAEMLQRHSPHLKPFMHRAATDEIIRDTGRASGLKFAQQFEDVLLLRRDEIRHPHPERAAHACFTAAYACFTRYLGLGTSPDAAGEGDWQVLKEDVVLICASFLQFADVAKVEPLAPPASTRKRRVKAGVSRG
jgi:AcrR family transcriptional regulator